MAIKKQDYKAFYNEYSSDLFDWSESEKNRIKSSKLYTIANKMEYLFRVYRNIQDGEVFRNGNVVTCPRPTFKPPLNRRAK